MAKYLVSVTRTAYRNTSIEVEADNPQEASNKAITAVLDVEFPGEYEARYTVEGLSELKG